MCFSCAFADCLTWRDPSSDVRPLVLIGRPCSSEAGGWLLLALCHYFIPSRDDAFHATWHKVPMATSHPRDEILHHCPHTVFMRFFHWFYFTPLTFINSTLLIFQYEQYLNNICMGALTLISILWTESVNSWTSTSFSYCIAWQSSGDINSP